ncbi:MAG: hypothetical protein K1V84_01055 [Muribaculaceae bacterium]
MAVLTIIALAALCRSFHTEEPLTMDYMGLLVGILAALCTILIGWQIYTLVDLKRVDEKFKDMEDNQQTEILRTSLQIYESVSALTIQIACGATKDELFPQSVMFELLAIVTCSKLGDFKECQAKIEILVQNNPHSLSITEYERELYLKALSEMVGIPQIQNYPSLISWVATLKAKPGD